MTHPLLQQRRRMASRPEAEPLPEAVYHALHEHEGDIHSLAEVVGDLKTSVASLTTAVASLDLAVKDGKANGRSETNKLIVTVVLAALGVLGGNKVINPTHEAPPAPAPITRSVVDIRLDECRHMQPGSATRLECVQRISGEVEK